MDLRLLEITVPVAVKDDLRVLLEDHPSVRRWEYLSDESTLIWRLLLPANQTESLSDQLSTRFAHLDGFQILTLRVEAVLPRLEEPAPAEPDPESQPQLTDTPHPESPAVEVPVSSRISREELHADITGSMRTMSVFLTLAVLSTVVASIGLIRDSVAVVIAAMVIAPLLGPNVALALATTLADLKLARRALRLNATGMALALLVAIAVGIIFPVDPSIHELETRLFVGPGDIILALSAGIAGVLAFTTGASSALIGVMVAVALVPPLAAFGLLIGSGHFVAALGALLLLATNIICVNLAAVATFLIQGVRPQTWWEAGRARKATRIALLLWLALLTILVALITFANQ